MCEAPTIDGARCLWRLFVSGAAKAGERANKGESLKKSLESEWLFGEGGEGEDGEAGMVVRRGRLPERPSSSEDSGSGSGSGAVRQQVNRQVALNTLAAMHRRFGHPAPVQFRATANRSLDALRRNIQRKVTEDIDGVIKKYLEKFFVPAVNNIRTNLGEESVNEDQLRAVCRAMLDGARGLYAAPPRPPSAPRPLRAPSPSEPSDSESSNDVANRRTPTPLSFSDSDAPPPGKRRLTDETLFVVGALANKAFKRRRRGPLRYPADSADKEWMANRNLKTSVGGKTHIMVLEDVEELISGASRPSCFRAPPFMLRKIQAYAREHGDAADDYASSAPTPTPPPPDATKEIKDEEANATVKIEDVKEEILDDDADPAAAGGSRPAGNFSPPIPAIDNNFWKAIAGNDGENSFDANIKAELTSADELMDADIEFLRGDFCSYAESEADVKRSFDKISEGGGEIFPEGSQFNRMESTDPPTINLTESPEPAKSSASPSGAGNVSVGTIQSQFHAYVGPAASSTSISQMPTTVFCQSQQTFSQLTTPLQAHLITPANLGQVSRVTWQPTATRTVYSIANGARGLPSTIPPGSTIVSIGNRGAGGILTAGSFINLTPKNFSTGNILHNAIVSRNMVNRGLGGQKIDLTKPTPVTAAAAVTKSTIVLPAAVGAFSRVSKMDDDMSITTTKAMIDNTCNSSAMLKQVLTLGSAGVNKTFLTPPSKTKSQAGPSGSALSASHATLSALLSGIDPSSHDKKGPFPPKGDK